MPFPSYIFCEKVEECSRTGGHLKGREKTRGPSVGSLGVFYCCTASPLSYGTPVVFCAEARGLRSVVRGRLFEVQGVASVSLLSFLPVKELLSARSLAHSFIQQT